MRGRSIRFMGGVLDGERKVVSLPLSPRYAAHRPDTMRFSSMVAFGASGPPDSRLGPVQPPAWDDLFMEDLTYEPSQA